MTHQPSVLHALTTAVVCALVGGCARRYGATRRRTARVTAAQARRAPLLRRRGDAT